MLQFFERVRLSRCSIEEQADMLLYQWGTYDWGRGQHFELNITRQVIPSSLVADPDILQLQLTFRFQPTPELRLLGKGDRWCESPFLLGGFREFILCSNAFQAVAPDPTGRPGVLRICRVARAPPNKRLQLTAAGRGCAAALAGRRRVRGRTAAGARSVLGWCARGRS